MKTLLSLSLLFLTVTGFGAESLEFAQKLATEHELNEGQSKQLIKILTTTKNLTRNIGNEDLNDLSGPNNSWHPATRGECKQRVLDTGIISENKKFKSVCGAKWMVPVPGTNVCIDQFEFPNLPCEYPLVWTPASAAKKICESMGKRVCNSHEWENACATDEGNANPYRFDLATLNERRQVVNANRKRVFAFSSALGSGVKTAQVCGIYDKNDPDFSPQIKNSVSELYSSIGKSIQCHGQPSDYATCGTNTWPAGMKYQCRTESGIYDMHGNVAEVVNFPTSIEGIARSNSEGETVTDRTERKGSFFVARDKSMYPDDCKVRQPYEHFKIFSTDLHSYYQEGFRCCKDVN